MLYGSTELQLSKLSIAMSVDINSTDLFFRHFVFSELPFAGNPSTSAIPVPLAYAKIFRGYDVRDWDNFGSEAAKALSSSELSSSRKDAFLSSWSSSGVHRSLLTEWDLTDMLGVTVFRLTTKLYDC